MKYTELEDTETFKWAEAEYLRDAEIKLKYPFKPTHEMTNEELDELL